MHPSQNTLLKARLYQLEFPSVTSDTQTVIHRRSEAHFNTAMAVPRLDTRWHCGNITLPMQRIAVKFIKLNGHASLALLC